MARFSRRSALQTAGAAAVVATTAAVAAPSAAAGGRSTGRIDTHHHALPEEMRRWAVDRGLLSPTGGPSWAFWTVCDALEVMGDNDIAAAVVSAPAAGFT